MPSTSSSTTVAFVVPNIIVAVAATLSVVAVVYYKTMAETKKSSSSSDDTVTITLPPWATAASAPGIYNKRYTTDEEMMTLAIDLSRRNVKEGTGGPFGAAIFERIRLGNNSNANNDAESKSATTTPPPIEEDEYCRLVSVGMNRVVPLNNSTLHGEMVAIQLAQQQLQTFSLNGSNNNDTNTNNKRSQYELFTSCEPCAMCLGGILWSGVSRLVCAATKDDAQSIGFDEGPVTAQSYVHLEESGCVVTRNVLRNEAREVLYNYGKTGVIYNGSVRSGGHLLRTHLMS